MRGSKDEENDVEMDMSTPTDADVRITTDTVERSRGRELAGRCAGCAASVLVFREFDDGPGLCDREVMWDCGNGFAKCYLCGGQVVWSSLAPTRTSRPGSGRAAEARGGS
ncbi:hypothetical protein EBM89_10445 [Cellulomonas triticagri]|uniref:Uncharacterized protein n=1 Tax=Cellulomonas triticagri TaxID=2483352 RepID=A0A3M2J5L3_9CELL|nr:hypothetical protein EBM89_10445 [Cellulomonas triticagri]